MKVTGKPNPAGSPAWRASVGRYVNKIGVSRERVDGSLGWWAWCGQCMETIGSAYHPTWRGAMDAAAAHADRHRWENAARERAAELEAKQYMPQFLANVFAAARARADELANTEGATD